MGDQPVTKADFEGFRADFAALITQMANLTTKINNQVAAFPNLVRNAGERDGEREPLQVRQGGNNMIVVEPVRVQQGENNRVMIDENTSSNEESMKEEIGQEIIQNNYDSHMDAEEELVKDELVEQGNQQNNHDYRVKADIPVFHGTMGVEELFDWQTDVNRFFDVMEVPENKEVKMVAIRLKKTAAVWWDKLVIQRQRQRTWRRKKTTIQEDMPEILTNLRELDSDGYLHDFPPMRDKVDEVLHQ